MSSAHTTAGNRRIVAGLVMSVDGVVESPGKWGSPHLGDESVYRQNNAILDSDVVEGLSHLRRRPGKNIRISGSVTLTRALLAAGLIDDLHLLVHPMILGRGRRLFTGEVGRHALRLARSVTFPTGVVHLHYQPAGPAVAQVSVSDR